MEMPAACVITSSAALAGVEMEGGEILSYPMKRVLPKVLTSSPFTSAPCSISIPIQEALHQVNPVMEKFFDKGLWRRGPRHFLHVCIRSAPCQAFPFLPWASGWRSFLCCVVYFLDFPRLFICPTRKWGDQTTRLRDLSKLNKLYVNVASA
ncbi:hypothetical protein B0J18DRAFT_415628 [Chaetomium sp. MPI-SDFR-AT-0129]|nr:hypothetical protein B0J18DRAFT_415628 [Chaetomium sp. MPI-SDFR-AT-0129]